MCCSVPRVYVLGTSEGAAATREVINSPSRPNKASLSASIGPYSDGRNGTVV
jgi:hypothetical protein